MSTDREEKVLSFSELKTVLDPEFSYIVFERCGIGSRHYAFSEVAKIFANFKRWVLQTRIFEDKQADKLFLLAKIDPPQTETIVNEISELGMPRGWTYYVYWKS